MAAYDEEMKERLEADVKIREENYHQGYPGSDQSGSESGPLLNNSDTSSYSSNILHGNSSTEEMPS
eukprot:9120477-Heterocapsa_arctica.AAC.1